MGKIMKSGVDYSAPPMINSYTKVESDNRYIPMTGNNLSLQNFNLVRDELKLEADSDLILIGNNDARIDFHTEFDLNYNSAGTLNTRILADSDGVYLESADGICSISVGLGNTDNVVINVEDEFLVKYGNDKRVITNPDGVLIKGTDNLTYVDIGQSNETDVDIRADEAIRIKSGLDILIESGSESILKGAGQSVVESGESAVIKVPNDDTNYRGITKQHLTVNYTTGLSGSFAHGVLIPTLSDTLTNTHFPNMANEDFSLEKVTFNVKGVVDVSQSGDSASANVWKGIVIPRHSNFDFVGVDNTAKLELTVGDPNSTVITVNSNSADKITRLNFKNLTIEGKNSTYAIYLMNFVTGSKSYTVFENCDIITRSVLLNNVGANDTVVFRNCIFDSEISYTINSGNGKLIFENCIFNTDVTLVGNSGTIIMNNCYVSAIDSSNFTGTKYIWGNTTEPMLIDADNTAY